MKEAPITVEQFIKMVVYSNLPNAFSAWLRRIIRASIHGADVLCRDLDSILTNKPDNSINRVLSAFLFALYNEAAIDRSLPCADMLYSSSLELCAVFDVCMDQPYPNFRYASAKAISTLNHFLAIHREWRRHNEQVILRRLTYGAVERMHRILSLRRPGLVNRGASTVTNTLASNAGDAGLLTMQFISKLANPIQSVLLDSSAVRMMHRMADSEFWGTQGLHTSRFVHELMIDQGFRLSIDQTIPGLSTKYSNQRVWEAGELILDAGTVIMWKCSKATEIIDLAEAIDIDMFPERLQNIPATVERIRHVVCRLYPGFLAAEVQTSVLGQDNRQALLCLLQYALILRNALANTEIDAIRQREFHDFVGYMQYIDQNLPVSIKTRRWIHAAVSQNGQATIVNLLARGDPFALLKLHDHAIMDIVLKNDSDGKYHDMGINSTLLPEILCYDAHRLQSIRLKLHSCLDKKSKSSREFNAGFRELVNSGTGKHKFTPLVAEAASELRAIIFVCRHRYGVIVSKTAHEIAKSIAANFV